MEPLLTVEEMREADESARTLGIPEIVLMEHAAIALVVALEERFAGILNQTKGLVVAGPGNNGGDVLAAARILSQKGVKGFDLVLTGAPHSQSSKTQLNILKNLGHVPLEMGVGYDWVLDGIFGIGLSGLVQGSSRTLIEKIGQLTPRPWVVSADIPSGLNANTGSVMGFAIEASETVTFGHLKRGHVTGLAANYVGSFRVDPIQIPKVNKRVGAYLFESGDIPLPKRLPSSHKGTYGHAKFWCGDKPGAALIAANIARRSGVGLVSLLGIKQKMDEVRATVSMDILCEVWNGIANCAAMGIGQGMGLLEDNQLKELLMQSTHIVLDADATHIISRDIAGFKKLIHARKSETVMTPHPKEAGRLLPGIDIESDRYVAVRKLSELFEIPVLLKGQGTLVASPGEAICVIWEGNSALSRGGSGDMLTGLVTGLLAQGMKGREALILGSYLLGETAERWVQENGTERTVLIDELSQKLGSVIGEYR